MNTDVLKSFYEQTQVRLAVKEYMQKFLDKKALDAVYSGEQASGYKEARSIITSMFSKLEEQYGEADKKADNNKAR